MNCRVFYLITCFLSIVELIFYYESTLNKTNKNFLLLCVTSLISNFGYSMSTYATNLETAMCGVMVSYIGSMLIAYFMLIVVIELCKRRFLIQFRITFLLIVLVLIVSIATTRETNTFFANPIMYTNYGLTLVRFTVGPFMWIYVAYLLSINLFAFAIIIDSIVRKKRVSQKILWSLLIMLVFGTAAYLVPLLMNIDFNCMPITYVVIEALFIVLSVRANMYDLSSNLLNVYKSRGNYGYIAFDSRKKYLGCDEFALQLFPELSSIAIDSIISEDFGDLIKKLHYDDENWSWDYHIETDFKINTNDSTAICTIHNISYKEKNIGYLLELRDDTQQQKYINNINLYNKELAKAVDEKNRKIYDIQDSIIKGMAMMIERRDNSTGGHILRTSDCIRIFANELLKHKEFEWCTPGFCACIIKAAPMHDLGKIAVDDSILRKPGKFNQKEYEEMKKHAEEGSYIVSEVLQTTTDDELKNISINVAHYHHEKWNGEGYPEHLKEEEIPVEARIMALADVFDALVSKRCYKEAKSFEEAFKIIKDDLGKHFDPELGQIFLLCRPQLEDYYQHALKN